jgi:hypothetical protein
MYMFVFSTRVLYTGLQAGFYKDTNEAKDQDSINPMLCSQERHQKGINIYSIWLGFLLAYEPKTLQNTAVAKSVAKPGHTCKKERPNYRDELHMRQRLASFWVLDA